MPEREDQTADFRSSGSTKHGHPDGPTSHGSALRIRCPHCHQRIELVGDDLASDVTCSTCGSSFNLVDDAAATYTSAVQRSIGQFELIEELGRGTFGSVWKARDTKLDRAVAIKIPRKGELDRSEVELFLREARAAAQLHHPNIVAVHEVGYDGEAVYMVTDLVRGVTLDAWLTGQRFTQREAARLCVKIAQALHHAHEHGVVHRDLKPANIMLDAAGEPFLMDFGLAKRERGELTMTLDGRVLGTPAYMSPEQARGEAHAADRRSDVYSLGVILFQLLTGEMPFRGNQQMLILQIVHHEPPSPRQLDARISRDVETICLKCLEKEPAKRYPSAAALAEDLERYLAGEPIRARPLRWWGKAWRWQKSHPLLGYAALLAALTLLTTAVVGMTGYVRTSRALYESELAQDSARKAAQMERLSRQEAIAEQRRAEAAAQRERMARLDAESARTSAERAAELERAARERAQESEAAAEAARARLENALVDTQTMMGLVADDQNRNEIAALWFAHASLSAQGDPVRRQDNRHRADFWSRAVAMPVRAMRLAAAQDASARLSFHPSGQFLLVQTAAGDCEVWDLAADTRRSIAGTGQDVVEARFARSGEWLVVGRASGTTEIQRFPAGDVVQSCQVPGRLTALALSPDERLLALASSAAPAAEGQGSRPRNVVRFWDCAQSSFLEPELEHPAPVVGLRFAPTGDRLVTSAADALARVFTIENGDRFGERGLGPITHRRADTGWQAPLVWDSPASLLTLQPRGVVEWRDLYSGEVRHSTPSQRGTVNAFRLSPDGRFLAILGFLEFQLWDVRRGEKLAAVQGHENNIADAAFSPDGALLTTVSGDRTTRHWLLPACSPSGPPIEHTNEVAGIAWDADGIHFATVQSDGLVQIWSYAASREVGNRTQFVAKDTLACLSPDGLHFAPAGNHRESSLFETQVFRVADCGPEGPPLPVDGALMAAAFAPGRDELATVNSTDSLPADSRGLVLSPRQKKGQIGVWNWRTGARIAGAIPTASLPIDCTYAPRGDRLFVCCAEGQILCIDPSRGEILYETAAEPLADFMMYMLVRCRFLAVTPDGTRLITAGYPDCVRIWDAPTGRPLHTLSQTGPVFDFQVSPDGSLLATFSQDRHVRIWNLTTGSPAGSDLEHPDWVFGGEFSEDGRSLLTACRDGRTRVWDWKTQELLCSPLEDDDEVFAAYFLDGDDRIVTACRKNYLRVWEPRSGKPLTPRLMVHTVPYQVRLAATKKQIVVAGMGPVIRVVDLEQLLRAASPSLTVEDLVRRQEIQAGSVLDRGGGAASLTTNAWYELWQEFQQRHADQFPWRLAAEDQAAWHVARYQTCELHEQYAAAAWHLDRLIGIRPDDGGYYSHRGRIFYRLDEYERSIADLTRAIELGDQQLSNWWYRASSFAARQEWERAAEAYSEVLQRRPADWRVWYARSDADARAGRWEQAAEAAGQAVRLGGNVASLWNRSALLPLAAGNPAGYRQACQTMLARFAGSTDPTTCNMVAWCSALGPAAVDDYSQPLALARHAVANDPKNAAYLHTLGTVLLRAGEYREALEHLNTSMAANAAGEATAPDASAADDGLPPGGEPHHWLLLAMTHQLAGDAQMARRWLDKATAQLDRPPPQPGPANDAGNWETVLEWKLLRAEAEKLLGTAAPDSKPPEQS